MDTEMQGLRAYKAFTALNKLLEGEKAVGSCWVFSYKEDKDGMIVRTKARLSAQGFLKRERVDIFHTSAPTPAAPSVKISFVLSRMSCGTLYVCTISTPRRRLRR
ncbi:unnamed protein product [Scytosiphon promiscuus]